MNLRAKTDGYKFSEMILKSKTCSSLRGKRKIQEKRNQNVCNKLFKLYKSGN